MTSRQDNWQHEAETAVAIEQAKNRAPDANPGRRPGTGKPSSRFHTAKQDVAYREFKARNPGGTPADFLEWLENSVEWMIARPLSTERERLEIFGDRTAYRIFQRNRKQA